MLPISCECLEHNPHYSATLINMLEHLSASGLFIVTCATDGRAEHGTSRTDASISPGTSSLGWDYYLNLTASDLKPIIENSNLFDFRFFENPVSHDLYLIGIANENMMQCFAALCSAIDDFVSSCQRQQELINHVKKNDPQSCELETRQLLDIVDEEKLKLHPLWLNKFLPVFSPVAESSFVIVLEELFLSSRLKYPSDNLAAINLASFFEATGRLELVKEFIGALDKEVFDNFEIYKIFVRVLIKRKEYSEAYVVLGKIQFSMIDDIEFLLLSGDLNLFLNKYDAAIKYFNRAWMLNPEGQRVCLLLVDALIQSGQFEECWYVLRAARKRWNNIAWIFIKEAEFWQKQDNDNRAKIALELGLFHHPCNKKMIDRLDELSNK